MAHSEKPAIQGSTPPELSEAASRRFAELDPHSDLFFAAVQLTRMPMLLTDPRQRDNPIIFANRAFFSMTGYTGTEIVGQNCRFLQGPETDRAKVLEIREAIEAVREVHVEILNYRKDGSTFWNALFISPVFTARGELAYFFASQLDVSRRRDAEGALAQAQKMEALGQLTGGIAHDFNNLLQVMSGHMEILGRRAREPVPDRDALLHGIDSTKSAIRRAATVTQQLLAFSRKQRLQGRPVNLNVQTRGFLDLIRQTLADAITLVTDFDANLANCHVDPAQFETALLNVIVNARDAMPLGGQVTIATSNVVVDPANRSEHDDLKPGAYVAIAVSDSGAGIPKEMLARVTEPFFTTKEEGKGTGLGLSMVLGFVTQSGGTLAIRSEPGQGTTIRLFFPASDRLVRPAAQVRSEAVHRGGEEKIMVVDDRAEVAEIARDMLESLGYAVAVYTDAQTALDDLGRVAPDLLFSDVIMPGALNGYLLATEARRRLPGLRVLLTTGYAGDAARRAPENHFEVLAKPYRLHDLAIKVRAVLDAEEDRAAPA